jgi:hypothetical protein
MSWTVMVSMLRLRLGCSRDGDGECEPLGWPQEQGAGWLLRDSSSPLYVTRIRHSSPQVKGKVSIETALTRFGGALTSRQMIRHTVWTQRVETRRNTHCESDDEVFAKGFAIVFIL